MNTTPIFKSGAVERNRTSTGKAHSDLNAARLPFPPRPLGFPEAFPPDMACIRPRDKLAARPGLH
jgi:hypothetical protein